MLLNPMFSPCLWARKNAGSEIRAKRYHDQKQQQLRSKGRLRTYCPALYTSSCASKLNPTVASNKCHKLSAAVLNLGGKNRIPQTPTWTTHPGKAPRQNTRDALNKPRMNGLKEKQGIATAKFSPAAIRQLARSLNLVLFFKKT